MLSPFPGDGVFVMTTRSVFPNDYYATRFEAFGNVPENFADHLVIHVIATYVFRLIWFGILENIGNSSIPQ